MAIAAIATFAPRPDKVMEFTNLFSALAADVRAEPGNRLCVLLRNREGEGGGAYVAVEIYDDEAALAAHASSPHVLEAGPELVALLAAEPTAGYFDVIEGAY